MMTDGKDHLPEAASEEEDAQESRHPGNAATTRCKR